MTPSEERIFLEGHRAAWRAMLSRCIAELGIDAPREARAIAELESARLALRVLCEKHGDNGWSDDLHLADVIEKHLARYL